MKVYVVMWYRVDESSVILAVYSDEKDAKQRVEQEEKENTDKWSVFDYKEYVVDEDKKA